MVQYSFASTETRRLFRTDSPGRPPRLSHGSWTITTQIIPGVSFISSTPLTPAQIKPKSFESRSNLFFVLTGAAAPHVYVRALDAVLLPQSYQYPNLLEGADRVGGQLRGVKRCPFSGVTSSGRVWRKVPESDTGSVGNWLICRLIQMVNWLNDVVDWNARLIGLYCQLIWVVACLIYWLIWTVDWLTWMVGYASVIFMKIATVVLNDKYACDSYTNCCIRLICMWSVCRMLSSQRRELVTFYGV